MFCAELMSGMKDVPSTERMVMCSHRWKLLKQIEKDAYQKRCEQVCSVLMQTLLMRTIFCKKSTYFAYFFHHRERKNTRLR